MLNCLLIRHLVFLFLNQLFYKVYVFKIEKIKHSCHSIIVFCSTTAVKSSHWQKHFWIRFWICVPQRYINIIFFHHDPVIKNTVWSQTAMVWFPLHLISCSITGLILNPPPGACFINYKVEVIVATSYCLNKLIHVKV